MEGGVETNRKRGFERCEPGSGTREGEGGVCSFYLFVYFYHSRVLFLQTRPLPTGSVSGNVATCGDDGPSGGIESAREVRRVFEWTRDRNDHRARVVVTGTYIRFGAKKTNKTKQNKNARPSRRKSAFRSKLGGIGRHGARLVIVTRRVRRRGPGEGDATVPRHFRAVVDALGRRERRPRLRVE